MKRLEEIEKMSLVELEEIAMDSSVKAPSDLQKEIGGLVNLLEMSEDSSKKWVRPVEIAASLLIAGGLGFGIINGRNELVDTYDDPALAYAQIEKALMRIGDGMAAGVESVQIGEECIEKPAQILGKNIK